MNERDYLWGPPTAREQLAQELLIRARQEQAWARHCRQAKRAAFWERWQLWIVGAVVLGVLVIGLWGS